MDRASKIIIEMNSNDFFFFDEWIPICEPLLTKSCYITWFAFTVQIIPHHVVFKIIVISKTKGAVQIRGVGPFLKIQKLKSL